MATSKNADATSMNDCSGSADVPPRQPATRATGFHPTGTFVEFPKADVERSIPERFENIVRLYPDRLALQDGDRLLTYTQLNQAANRIANAILARCGTKQEPIALLMNHGADAMAAILGVLKADKIYLPLDPRDPSRKNASMLEDSEARLLVSDSRHSALLNDFPRPGISVLDLEEIGRNHSGENLGLPIPAASLAYIMYTSGSTGKPKAVTQNHRNVLHNTMVSTNLSHYCSEDRFTLLHSFANGSSINHLFGALLNGGALFPLDVRTEGAACLPRHVAEKRITIYHSIPALFRQFAASLTGSEVFPDLRVLTLSGDTVAKKDVELYKKHFSSDCVFVERLGTREVAAVFFHMMNQATEIAGNLVPVGTAVDGMEISLVDDNGKPVGVNEVGEIVVTSRYLSPGYWRDPDLTMATFLPAAKGGDERIYRTGDLGRLRPDGCYENLGRKDSRVKIRGYRVEMGEVESVLRDLDFIKNAVVTAVKDASGEHRLAAYLVPTEEVRPSSGEIRRALSQRLPDYMIPSTFVYLDALPLMFNGKVDRRALPDFGRSRPDLGTPFAAPTTALEDELAQIWAEALGLDRIGVHDEFFELGGHSLAAARIASRLIKRFQLALPIQSLFAVSTVAQMAAIVSAHSERKPSEKELERLLSELELLTDREAQRLVSDNRVNRKD